MVEYLFVEQRCVGSNPISNLTLHIREIFKYISYLHNLRFIIFKYKFILFFIKS
jgi:hypothetical protein